MNLNWLKEHESVPYEGEQKQGYTITYIPHLKSLVLIGGNLSRANQIYIYNLITKCWTIQKITSAKPIPRKYHTAFYEKQIKGIIVYGGQAQKKRSLDCFWVLFVEDWKWRKLAFKTSVPAARQFHTFTSMSNGNFLIFGGISLPYQTYLQDLWVLKGIDKLKDTKTTQIAGCSCIQLTGKGQPPPGRYAHSAYFYSQNLYIIGGQASKQQDSFTIYNLNFRSMIWQKNIFNINLNQLIGTLILTNPQQSNQVFIFGGITNKNQPNNNLYTLSFYETNENMINNQNYHSLSNATAKNINIKLKKHSKLPSNDMYFDSSCELPFNQLFGVCCYSVEGKISLYRVELAGKTEELGLQEYLKYIKNQQLLSQQLLKKVSNMQQLFQEIQSYTSKLFRQYRDSGEVDQTIEKQKKSQVEACIELKEQYRQIEGVYQRNVNQLKKARKDLAILNEYFEGCIETERDEE